MGHHLTQNDRMTHTGRGQSTRQIATRSVQSFLQRDQVISRVGMSASCLVLAPFLAAWLFFWSLEHGVVPSSMKSAYITPILKNADLDASDPKSYRPISNLSKLLERLVSKQFVAYLLENDLFADLQSAYRTIITRRRLLFSRSCRISYHWTLASWHYCHF